MFTGNYLNYTSIIFISHIIFVIIFKSKIKKEIIWKTT